MTNNNEIDQMLNQLQQEEADTSYMIPDTNQQESHYKFFREILKSGDSRKVGNLKSDELGKLNIAVRHLHELSAYCKTENFDRVADYFTNLAEITSSTSMSRNGFLLNTLVTQIKKQQNLTGATESKPKWWQFKNEGENEDRQ